MLLEVKKEKSSKTCEWLQNKKSYLMAESSSFWTLFPVGKKALIFAIIGGTAAGNTLTRFVLACICGDY